MISNMLGLESIIKDDLEFEGYMKRCIYLSFLVMYPGFRCRVLGQNTNHQTRELSFSLVLLIAVNSENGSNRRTETIIYLIKGRYIAYTVRFLSFLSLFCHFHCV